MPELRYTDAELDALADALAPRIESRLNRRADAEQAVYTPTTLAAEIGRSPRSIRAAIARGELEAVKRGRGWIIGADAVATWARGESSASAALGRPRRRSRSGPGPMARALARHERAAAAPRK
jgi:hypothetical protein